jgi:AcrR family transcriptional regulator
VLTATLEILAERQLHGLRADLVAQRAGVPKSSIYRRWPSMTRLAIDAVEHAVGPRPFEPSSDPADDIRRLVELVYRSLIANPLRHTIVQIAGELLADPEVADDYRARVVLPLRAAAIDAVARGTAAGAWSIADPELAVDMVIGAIIYRMVYLDVEVTLDQALRTIDLISG